MKVEAIWSEHIFNGDFDETIIKFNFFTWINYNFSFNIYKFHRSKAVLTFLTLAYYCLLKFLSYDVMWPIGSQSIGYFKVNSQPFIFPWELRVWWPLFVLYAWMRLLYLYQGSTTCSVWSRSGQKPPIRCLRHAIFASSWNAHCVLTFF